MEQKSLREIIKSTFPVVNKVWVILIILLFSLLIIVLFPMMTFSGIAKTQKVNASNGYLDLGNLINQNWNDLYKIEGEWEFYPNELYTNSDFISGSIKPARIVTFPHYWKDEPQKVIGNIGYATYRVQIKVPVDFDEMGLFSRFQYSAYRIYLNDFLVCGSGTVNTDFELHQASYQPSWGSAYFPEESNSKTINLIVQVQNNTHVSAGLSKHMYFAAADSIKELRVALLFFNGLITGGLLLLFLYFLLVFLNGREKREYLDYTVVTILMAFISMTSTGESLLYSTGEYISGVFLMRLEYCALITAAFFASHHLLKMYIKNKKLLMGLEIYVIISNLFFLLVPPLIFTRLNILNIIVSVSFFLIPLVISSIDTIKKRDSDSVISFFSFLAIFAAACFYVLDLLPWNSVDLFSLAVIVHCILQIIIFLRKYGETEVCLKNMTETLEERIHLRTVELQLMKEKAEAATTAKSNFITTLSNEIRTPMNAIIGMSEMMRTDNLDDVQSKYFMDIRKISNSLMQVISDVLDFSAIEAGKFEISPIHFDLAALYEDICSIGRFSAQGKNLEFRNSMENDIPHVIVGDEGCYKQVIMNLIDNAIKYTQDGYVDFQIRKVMADEKAFLEFVVIDSGIGVKEEDFPNLFTAFYQLRDEAGQKIAGAGLGLGLAITKLLVNLMDGMIGFTSEYEMGSTFTIRLPLIEGDISKVDKSEEFIPVFSKDAKALIIDDNAINVTAVRGFLATHGIQADTAESGMEGIEKIKQEPYDILFMNHLMPVMDGIEATQIIRSMDINNSKEVPIIAMSAYATAGIREVFINAGMNDFVSKPIKAATLNSILGRWLSAEKVVLQNKMTLRRKEAGITAEEETILMQMRRIDNLDVDSGLSNVGGSEKTYLEIMRRFCRDLDAFIAELNEHLESESWRDYTIKIHALRGIFANIGSPWIAEWAYKIENAAREKDYILCRGETGPLCTAMQEIQTALLETKLMK